MSIALGYSSLRIKWKQMDQVLGLAQQIRAKCDEIQKIAAKHGARKLRLFGSVARGDAQAESDVDFLIEAGPVTSSWFPAGLILDL